MQTTGIALGALLTIFTAFIGIVIWTFVNHLKQKESIEHLHRLLELTNDQFYKELNDDRNGCNIRFDAVYQSMDDRISSLERIIADDRKEVLSIIDSKKTTKTKSKKQLNG